MHYTNIVLALLLQLLPSPLQATPIAATSLAGIQARQDPISAISRLPSCPPAPDGTTNVTVPIRAGVRLSGVWDPSAHTLCIDTYTSSDLRISHDEILIFRPTNGALTSEIYAPPAYDVRITYSFPDKSRADQAFDIRINGTALGKAYDEHFPIARGGPGELPSS